jgi:DNA-binding Lrp family transcriptional regulator
VSSILVIFQSDSEQTEQRALAVAVGAVEAEGSIRLRRLAAAGAVEVGHKGYGRLQRADLLWADTVVAGLESDSPRAELDELLQLLSELDPGQVEGKQAWTFGPDGLTTGETEAQIFVESALRVAGITVLPTATLDVGHADNMTERLKEAGRLSGRRQRLPDAEPV